MSKSRISSGDARTCKRPSLRIFQSQLNQLYKDIGNYDIETLFMLEYKGYKFNALPFVLNGASYFSVPHHEAMYRLLSKVKPTPGPVGISDLMKPRLLDFKVFSALMPGVPCRRELYLYLLVNNQVDALRLICQGAAMILNRVVIFNEYSHIEYQYKDICNTQAFCFYMTVYWLMNVNSALRSSIGPDLKRSNFLEIFDSLCPESSIHFRYIKGEITSDKLVDLYTRQSFEDESSISIREAYSNLSRGSYDGSLMTSEQLGLGMEELAESFRCDSLEFNNALGAIYLYGGTYGRLQSELDAALYKQKKLEADVDLAKTRRKKAEQERNELRKENRVLNETVKRLKVELAKQTTDDMLKKRIADLEQELQESRAENDELFEERIRLKQELSVSAKTLKRLTSLVGEQVGTDESEEGSGVAVESISTSDMISVLKDKRIVMIGGDRSKSVVKTFEDWGFTSFVLLSDNVRRMDCDFCVICTILCSHRDVRMAERMWKSQDTEFVYVSGVNAELILRSVYESYMSR